MEGWSRITIPGTCEHIYSYDSAWPGGRIFPSKSILEDLHDFLLHYGRVYETAGYYGPVMVYYRLVNAKGAVLGVRNRIRSGERAEATKEEFVWPVEERTEEVILCIGKRD